jgi:hypothetical protein
MRKLHFYSLVTVLVVVNTFFLSHPNLIGRLGIIFYKHHYLRTFPRTLLTVVLVVGTAAAAVELIQFATSRKWIKRVLAKGVLYMLLLTAFGLLVYTALLFSSGTYSHTGVRFGIGALMLPALLVLVFVFGLTALPAYRPPFPESMCL